MIKRSPKKLTPRRSRQTEPVGGKHEAGWLRGLVPNGYWVIPENRRRYMRWLGQGLGYRKLKDWYGISTDDFKRNHGGGLLAQHWNSSAVTAVMECFPGYDWKEWLFATAPRSFWKDARNRRRYMKWLGQHLGVRRPEDWYQVTNRDFAANKGGAFLLQFKSTISAAIMAYLPRYAWKEWMFGTTPKGLWEKRRNRRRYMKWLAKKLGFKRSDDWYSVTQQDFRANYGGEFLRLYGGSPVAAVKDVFPRRAWNEWMFARVPVGFWQKAENRKRYLKWLGERLGFNSPQDWYDIRRDDFRRNCGGGLLASVHSHVALLKEHMAEIAWET